MNPFISLLKARRFAPLTDFSGEPVHRLVQNDAKGRRKEKEEKGDEKKYKTG